MNGLCRWAIAAVVLIGAATACGSTHSARSVSKVGSTVATGLTSTTSTVSLQVTVPDCGAGAYRPSTLLIVCANAGTMATGIRWISWTSEGANGVGTVQLQAGTGQQSGQANLQLSDVVEKGTAGPQFTRLTVSWIGRSPDGHPSDSFQLGNG